MREFDGVVGFMCEWCYRLTAAVNAALLPAYLHPSVCPSCLSKVQRSVSSIQKPQNRRTTEQGEIVCVCVSEENGAKLVCEGLGGEKVDKLIVQNKLLHVLTGMVSTPATLKQVLNNLI